MRTLRIYGWVSFWVLWRPAEAGLPFLSRAGMDMLQSPALLGTCPFARQN